MFDGSLYGNWQAIVTLQQMIVLCDVDGVVDMTPQAIAARTSIPMEIIQAGIETLEQPDKYSRTPDADGRRIERLDTHRPWGWRIVNYKKYRHLVDSETIREQNRERQRRHRESRYVTDGNAVVTEVNAASRYAEAEAEAEVNINTPVPQAGPSDVEIVFAHWQNRLGHPNAKLTPDRRKKIAKALKHHPVAALTQAIDGCAVTPHNMGQNDRGERYDDISLILRDDAHIERFCRNAQNPPKPKSGNGRPSFDDHHKHLQTKIEEAAHGRQPIADAKRLD